LGFAVAPQGRTRGKNLEFGAGPRWKTGAELQILCAGRKTNQRLSPPQPKT
jgi:hypothetical protein